MNSRRYPIEPCGLDWNLVQSIDPILLYETQDYKTMERFLSIFIKTQLGKGDQIYLSTPQSFRVVLILQTILKYMFRCQDQLKEENSHLQEKIEVQKQKINLLYKAQDRNRAIVRDAYVDYEKCPICGKKYKSIAYVDRHIQNHHNLHLMAWKSLRTDVPINPKAQVKEMKEEILKLHKQINSQTEKFAQTIIEFQTHINNLENEKYNYQNRKPDINFFEFHPNSKTDSNPRSNIKNQFDSYEPLNNVSTVSRSTNSQPFKPNIVTFSVEDSGPENEQITFDERLIKIKKEVEKTAKNLSYGLGPNYFQKDQVKNILQFKNPTYSSLHRQAEIEIQEQFPLPGEEPPKRQKADVIKDSPSSRAMSSAIETSKSSSKTSEASKISKVSSSKHSSNFISNSEDEKPHRKSIRIDETSSKTLTENAAFEFSNDSDYNQAESDLEMELKEMLKNENVIEKQHNELSQSTNEKKNVNSQKLEDQFIDLDDFED